MNIFYFNKHIFMLLCTRLIIMAGAERGRGSFAKRFRSLGEEIGGIADKVISTIIENIDFSGSSDCAYNCRNGLVPIQNPDYKSSVNGCGSFGVEISLHDLPELTKCCNAHDVCYDICGQRRSVCDRELQDCAIQVCLKASKHYQDNTLARPACETLGEMMYKATSMLGCEPFRSSQQKACKCVHSDYREEL